MYLKQHGLKISGSKADLTKRVLSHARENAARDVLEDEEFYNSCEDDTTTESESSDSDGENSYVNSFPSRVVFSRRRSREPFSHL